MISFHRNDWLVAVLKESYLVPSERLVDKVDSLMMANHIK